MKQEARHRSPVGKDVGDHVAKPFTSQEMMLIE